MFISIKISEKIRSALAEIHLGNRASEAIRSPPLLYHFRLDPSLPNELNRRVKDAGKYKVAFLYKLRAGKPKPFRVGMKASATHMSTHGTPE